MKHTIRGHERETNVETREGKKNPLREEDRARSLPSLAKKRKRDFICAPASNTRGGSKRERKTERDAITERENAKQKEREKERCNRR